MGEELILKVTVGEPKTYYESGNEKIGTNLLHRAMKCRVTEVFCERCKQG